MSIDIVDGRDPGVDPRDGPAPAEHRVSLVDDRAAAFDVRCQFGYDIELVITSTGENGITFEGEKGTFFVTRGKLTGPPVDELKANPIPEKVLVGLRKGKRLDSHMGNFIECCRDRSLPVSDVYSHHRSLTTCHLANIALRLGRKLTLNPAAENFVKDDEANGYLTREYRNLYVVPERV